MKTNFLTALLCAAALCLYGCDDDCDCSSEGKNISDNSGDVSELISDDYFRQYCLRTFDTNYDGKLSQTEADAVTQIVVTSPTSSRLGGLEVDFSGIEHFKNLEYFESNLAVGVVDLSQNTKLTRVLLNDSAVEEVDLRNTNMTTINDYAFYLYAVCVAAHLAALFMLLRGFRRMSKMRREARETRDVRIAGIETEVREIRAKCDTMYREWFSQAQWEDCAKNHDEAYD